MGNRWKWLVLASLGSLVIGQNAMADSISPSKQQLITENLQIKNNEMELLHQKLLHTGWDNLLEKRVSYGNLDVVNAQSDAINETLNIQKQSATSLKKINGKEDFLVSLNVAEEYLKSDSGDLAVVTSRARIRKIMYSFWEIRKREILQKVTALSQENSNSRQNEKNIFNLKKKCEDRYLEAFRKTEYLTRLYNGENDPSLFKGYKKETDRAVDAFQKASMDFAIEKTKFGHTNSDMYQKMIQLYGDISVLEMQDAVHLKLLEERMDNKRKEWNRSYNQYKKLFSLGLKNGYIVKPQINSTQQERDAEQQKIIVDMYGTSLEQWRILSYQRVNNADELYRRDYFNEEAGIDQTLIATKPTVAGIQKWRLDGEARLDYGSHRKEESIGDRVRGRVRIYADYNIDNNWQLFTMLENEKILAGRGKDRWMKIDRYYLTGMVGDTRVTAGTFGTILAEGNIYDGRFTGVRMNRIEPVNYLLEVGKTKHNDFVAAGECYFNKDDYLFGVGAYRFNFNDESDQNIFMMNIRHPWKNWNFGVMALYGTNAEEKKLGYVFSLEKGIWREWVQGNKQYFIKYYYQPHTTYISHTMNGMADYMPGGFQGIGTGYYYTLKKNWVLQLEAYRLHDIETGVNNHSVWIALSYYFSNYDS